MRIKFVNPDPRAGQVVEMDSRRGHDFIAAGVAVEDGKESKPEPEVEPESEAPKPKRGRAKK